MIEDVFALAVALQIEGHDTEDAAVLVTQGQVARRPAFWHLARMITPSGFPIEPVIARLSGQPGIQKVPSPKLTLFVRRNFIEPDLCAELMALMPHKPPPDLSRFLLSPMPGLLADVAVVAGQAVRAGEKLAVIEAMKMENILVAAQDGVVAKVVAGKGESLAVDQVILEFQ